MPRFCSKNCTDGSKTSTKLRTVGFVSLGSLYLPVHPFWSLGSKSLLDKSTVVEHVPVEPVDAFRHPFKRDSLSVDRIRRERYPCPVGHDMFLQEVGKFIPFFLCHRGERTQARLYIGYMVSLFWMFLCMDILALYVTDGEQPVSKAHETVANPWVYVLQQKFGVFICHLDRGFGFLGNPISGIPSLC